MNTYSNRLDSLKANIRATEQRLAAIGPASPHRFELTATLANLESELEAQYVRNAEGKKEAAERKAEQERQIEEHQRQEADALEADLRRRFRQAAPGGSDADFQLLKPRLLEQRAEEQQTAHQREAERYSFLPDGAVIITE